MNRSDASRGQPETQLAFPGADELFRSAGLETLPVGASEMTPKQLRFCLRYLECGNATHAAREAGYSPDNAEKLRKNTGIARFLAAAIKPVAENGDQLVRRKWELSASLHAELMELRGKPANERTSRDEKREAALMLAVTRNDTLLAAMLDRLGIKLTGDVTHTHTGMAGGEFVVVPPESLGGFASMRQEVVAVNCLVSTRRAD